MSLFLFRRLRGRGFLLLFGLSCFWLLGCQGGQNAQDKADAIENSPISQEYWRKMPDELRFDPKSLERLRASDPKFSNPEVWEEFMVNVVAPEMKAATGGGETE